MVCWTDSLQKRVKPSWCLFFSLHSFTFDGLQGQIYLRLFHPLYLKTLGCDQYYLFPFREIYRPRIFCTDRNVAFNFPAPGFYVFHCVASSFVAPNLADFRWDLSDFDLSDFAARRSDHLDLLVAQHKCSVKEYAPRNI